MIKVEAKVVRETQIFTITITRNYNGVYTRKIQTIATFNLN